MTKNISTLPGRQQSIAQAYWQMYIVNDSEKDHSMLIRFLNGIPNAPDNLEMTFSESIKNKNYSLFVSLFKHLSLVDLRPINDGEQLNVIPPLSDQSIKISSTFIQEVQDFMRDTGFSGVVAISDGVSIYTIPSDKLTKSDAPFAMHSVGKMFTGTLMLRLIEEAIISEGVLDHPIQLDDEVIKKLSPAVREQLKLTTLHDVMLHRGRYGDYLEKYQSAIEVALKQSSPVPLVNDPKDFLIYADEELRPLDKLGPEGDSYSNLGILLVGLSIEHLYNQHAEKTLSYAEILNQFVLRPAGVEIFETQMPKEARYNKEDHSASHISGGPAGGYWSTAGDLLRFGRWLGEKSREESFMRLLESYGGEFYGNRDISHGGSIESASAHLSHRIDNGLTIAVMSDMTGPGQASKLAQAIQEHLLEK